MKIINKTINRLLVQFGYEIQNAQNKKAWMELLQRLVRKLKITIWSPLRFCKLLPSYLTERETHPKKVVYVVEDINWSLKWDGIHITDNLIRYGRQGWVDTSPSLYKNKIIHFGAGFLFAKFASKLNSRKNKYLVTFFHGKYGDDPIFDRPYEAIKKHIASIAGVIYSTPIMKERFIEFGLPENKLFYIPIGVDLTKFKPLASNLIKAKRKALGIPDNALVLGSFQKDGEGWYGEGMIPKLIKGPDVFIETVKRLNNERPVFCLLSGPARGYVKQGLQDANVPFIHQFFDDYFDTVSLYQILDAYVITSREEGGPKALLEAMACGVPVITTDVGMARDVIDGHNCGIVCDINDIDALVASTLNITSDRTRRAQMVANGLARVKDYDWPNISKACEQVYRAIE